jgi:hypothetical protein
LIFLYVFMSEFTLFHIFYSAWNKYLVFKRNYILDLKWQYRFHLSCCLKEILNKLLNLSENLCYFLFLIKESNQRKSRIFKCLGSIYFFYRLCKLQSSVPCGTYSVVWLSAGSFLYKPCDLKFKKI